MADKGTRSGISNMQKLKQLWRVVRESHAEPMTGTHHAPVVVSGGETAITFIGHSSFLIQIAGRNLLIDPVFATRLILMRRQRRPGVRVKDLPQIHAVLLTHAHMDHLNLASLRAVCREMRRRKLPAPVAIVPRGVSDLVRKCGFSVVHEMEWWQEHALNNSSLTITATPARHWGARMFKDTHRGYGGYVIAAARRAGARSLPTVYHSGDTAYFKGFAEIGARLKPEVALLPIGAYSPDSYRAVHTSPEEALQAFVDLGASTLVPMHFGTFKLGREPMAEPPVRLRAAAEQRGLRERVRILEEGQTWVVD